MSDETPSDIAIFGLLRGVIAALVASDTADEIREAIDDLQFEAFVGVDGLKADKVLSDAAKEIISNLLSSLRPSGVGGASGGHSAR